MTGTPTPPCWKDAFKSTTTRVGFVLTLTRPMLEMLSAASDDVEWDRARFGNLLYPDNWAASERALTKRGLLERKPPRPSSDRTPPWRLTPAGEALIGLLKVGGLYIQAQAAVEKMAKRRGRN